MIYKFKLCRQIVCWNNFENFEVTRKCGFRSFSQLMGVYVRDREREKLQRISWYIYIYIGCHYFPLSLSLGGKKDNICRLFASVRHEMLKWSWVNRWIAMNDWSKSFIRSMEIIRKWVAASDWIGKRHSTWWHHSVVIEWSEWIDWLIDWAHLENCLSLWTIPSFIHFNLIDASSSSS